MYDFLFGYCIDMVPSRGSMAEANADRNAERQSVLA